MRYARRPVIVALVLGLGLVLGACGGGGGGGGPTSGPVTFHYGAISGSIETSDFRQSRGTAILQPDGSFVAEVETTIHGGPPQPSTSSGRLTLAGDGRASLHVAGTLVLEGYHSDNGAVVILAANGSIGAPPTMVVLTRVDTSTARDDMEGLFLVNGVDYLTTEAEYSSIVGGYAIGVSAGSIEVPTYRNTNDRSSGTLAAPWLVGSYDVLDGRAGFRLPFSIFTMEGALSADREFLWATGAAPTTQPASAWTGARAMIRASSTASNASFAGRYGYVMLMRGNLPAFVTWHGTLQADGAGGGTILGIEVNSEGQGGSNAVEVPLSTAINIRGEFTCQLGGASVLQGAISNSGRYATLGGSITDGLSPQFWIMVRLPLQ